MPSDSRLRCSANPAALLALAAAGHQRSARLRGAVFLLVEAGLPGPALALSRHAGAAADLDSGVGLIGRAFAAADSGRSADPRITWVQPQRGDGTVAVFGDVASARHIAIVVPGMATDLTNAPRTLERAARDIYDAASAMDHDVAVIAWLGYDAPELLTALHSGRAARGGAALAAYVASLRHRFDGSITVIGHSYGSLVVAEGLRRGMHVDRVVVAGSPGLGVSNVDDLALDGAALFALRAPFDAAGLSEAFGRDPADPRFGATRLDTGDGRVQPIGHSSYFDPGTLSLRNIAAVVVGHDDELVIDTPSNVEVVQDVIDDYWRASVDPPIDAAQDALAIVNGALHTLDELPGPLGAAASSQSAARDALIEATQRMVDLLQRATTPDFVGDLLSDAWDALR